MGMEFGGKGRIDFRVSADWRGAPHDREEEDLRAPPRHAVEDLGVHVPEARVVVVRIVVRSTSR